MKAVTADQFAAQLRAGGCKVEADHFPGAVYLTARKATRHGFVTMVIVFEGDRFARAFAPQVGVHRRRWDKFRTMKGVRRFMEVETPETAERENSR